MDGRLQDSRARPEQPALSKFNRLFHELYSARADDVWRQLESGEIPALVRMDDRLILLSNGRAMEYEITGERYHELKAASHIPAAVHLALTEPGTEPGTRAKRVAALAAGLDDVHAFGAGVSAIVSATRTLLEQVPVPNRGQDLHEALAGYRIAVRCVLETLAREAARLEIETLDRAMSDIEGRLGRKREQAYFVICAGHQPRYKELSKMYFRRRLADAGWPQSWIAHHVVYAEGKESLSEALGLVRTRIIDGQLSAALFDDLVSLDEDVLGDAGLEQLDRRFGS